MTPDKTVNSDRLKPRSQLQLRSQLDPDTTQLHSVLVKLWRISKRYYEQYWKETFVTKLQSMLGLTTQQLFSGLLINNVIKAQVEVASRDTLFESE